MGEGKRDRGRKGKRLGAEINFQVSELTGKGGKYSEIDRGITNR